MSPFVSSFDAAVDASVLTVETAFAVSYRPADDTAVEPPFGSAIDAAVSAIAAAFWLPVSAAVVATVDVAILADAALGAALAQSNWAAVLPAIE